MKLGRSFDPENGFAPTGQAADIYTTARAIVLTSICLRKYTSGHITKAGEEIDWLI